MTGKTIVLNARDNVAIAMENIAAGTELEFKVEGKRLAVTVREPVSFGHKISLRHFAPGDKVIKYGEVIGEATAVIEPGEHVHLHNLASRRGRGDLVKEEK